MAISVDWNTKVIFIPKSDLTLIQSIPTEIRQLDLNVLRLELKGLEDDEGITYEDTHNHNQPVSVGGVTLARVIEIINGYSVTFEDGQYAVNLVGANSNLSDVTNVNQVSVRSSNSAGLTSASPTAISPQNIEDIVDAVWNAALSNHVTPGSAGITLSKASIQASIAAALSA